MRLDGVVVTEASWEHIGWSAAPRLNTDRNIP